MQRRFGQLRQRVSLQLSPYTCRSSSSHNVHQSADTETDSFHGFDLRLARISSYMTSKCLLLVSSLVQRPGLDTHSTEFWQNRWSARFGQGHRFLVRLASPAYCKSIVILLCNKELNYSSGLGTQQAGPGVTPADPRPSRSEYYPSWMLTPSDLTAQHSANFCVSELAVRPGSC